MQLACGSKPQTNLYPPGAGTPATAAAKDDVMVQLADLPQGLALRLSEGKDQPGAVAALPVAPAQKLADADAQKLLARMPALVGQAGDRQDFALRERSQPPPR